MATPPKNEFDGYSADYQRYLNSGRERHFSGETMDYFCQGRINWLARALRQRNCVPCRILDFGCGIGNAAAVLSRVFPNTDVLGVDVSSKSLEIASDSYASLGVRFAHLSGFDEPERYDLIHCNGVFHHVPIEQRAEAMRTVFKALRPGGYFSLWENNPWHPVVRYIMNHAEIDQDAVMVWPRTARGLCREAGFRVLATDFLFVFPRILKYLRFTEPWLSFMPLGGQYEILCQKPGTR